MTKEKHANTDQANGGADRKTRTRSAENPIVSS
jgi:hypothetical protein